MKGMYRIVVPVVLLALAAGAFVAERQTRPGETASGAGQEVVDALPLLSASRLQVVDDAALPEDETVQIQQPGVVQVPVPDEAESGVEGSSTEREAVFIGLPPEIPELGGPEIDALADRLNDVLDRLPASYRTCFVVRQREKLGDFGFQQLNSIFSHRPELSLVPASNLKLATAAAALLQLGPDYRLTTRVLASRLPANGELYGDLYLVGGGDPLLYTSKYLAAFLRPPSVYTQIEDLAQQVYNRGLRRVFGSIVGVATRYDDRRIASQLMSQESYQYVGPLSALLINDGYTNYAQRRYLGTLSRPAADPTLFTAAEFDDLLEALDMVITQRPRVAGPDENIRGFIEIASIESAPLSELLLSLLTDSDNTTAELLVKEIATNRAVAELLAQQPEERVLELPEEEEGAEQEEGGGEDSETEQDPQSSIQESGIQESRLPSELSSSGIVRIQTESGGEQSEFIIDLSDGPETGDGSETEEEGTSPTQGSTIPEQTEEPEQAEEPEQTTGEDTGLKEEQEEGEPERVIPPTEDPEVVPLTAEPGSTQAGVEAVAQILTDNGIDSWVGIPRDGSGLDNRNLMSCAAAVDILDFFGPQSDFSEALAKAAQTGTLLDRFANTSLVGRLRGKTGSLPGATTLSGFIDAGADKSLTFSLFINHGFTDTDVQRALFAQREAMLALAEYLDG